MRCDTAVIFAVEGGGGRHAVDEPEGALTVRSRASVFFVACDGVGRVRSLRLRYMELTMMHHRRTTPIAVLAFIVVARIGRRNRNVVESVDKLELPRLMVTAQVRMRRTGIDVLLFVLWEGGGRDGAGGAATGVGGGRRGGRRHAARGGGGVLLDKKGRERQEREGRERRRCAEEAAEEGEEKRSPHGRGGVEKVEGRRTVVS